MVTTRSLQSIDQQVRMGTPEEDKDFTIEPVAGDGYPPEAVQQFARANDADEKVGQAAVAEVEVRERRELLPSREGIDAGVAERRIGDAERAEMGERAEPGEYVRQDRSDRDRAVDGQFAEWEIDRRGPRLHPLDAQLVHTNR